MPKSVEDILANAENLSKRIRDFEPSKKYFINSSFLFIKCIKEILNKPIFISVQIF